ncbi:hypothetical protein Sme01_54370 [Sphaerisporangium melleum]|uniref:Serine protease n=1 Tax=Sphaerisporangium melleum TaxID=321316 RepID=A0A917R6Q4_9ACTN|nr:S8 family serine peptidase [Sphaerisporangium melleum]GGK91965.1 hypothetical protein GCM10007964_38230 [Sphaerisporangium melleum]GII72961.1 hypothetical protein Sme01_54370 [Sphaerisporangium melleum]
MTFTSRRTSATRGALALTALVLAVASPTPATAAAEPPVPVPSSVAAQVAAGRYLVTLAEKPIATYEGGVGGIGRTRPVNGKKVDVTSTDARRYRDHLAERQNQVAATVGATPVQRFAVASNTFVADLTGAQALKLMRTPGVVSVVPNKLHKATDDRNSTDFLKLSGPKGLWSALGGTDKAGKGVVIGVIDTGVWPESASFAAPALDTAQPTAGDPYRPYREGAAIVMRKADGSTFTGTCQTGDQFSADLCNQKLIGARYFSAGWEALVPPDQRADYLSPRDGGGHGTHTASTAAGNADVPAKAGGIDFGRISGVAPGAKIAVYKALYEGKTANATGGTDQDLVAAIDQAVADGVDVINYSVGSIFESDPTEPTQLAFLHAAAAGIFVSTAGGNSGPDASTLDNTAPWQTTVAASSVAPYSGSVRLGDGRTFTGVSTTLTGAVGPAPLVRAVAVKNASATDGDATLCVSGSLDPAKTAGKIVVCDRGVNARVEKSAEVARAGGAGMVLVNPGDQSTDGDLHSVPTVHLNTPDAATVRTYAGTAGAQATLVPGGTSMPYPQIASFSSRGPSLTNGGNLLKPDIAAPGVSILAAVAPPSNHGHEFDFYSGTSMAAPHIAGLAALYLAKYPTMSPMSVKSAMMTTAGEIKTATGETSTDVFAHGSGEVTPARMFDPGLVYDSGAQDWLGYLEGRGVHTGTGVAPIETSQLNYPSIAVGQLLGTTTITRRVTAVTPGVYHGKLDIPGVSAKLSPHTLKFTAAGQTKEFTVTFGVKSGSTTGAQIGSLTWTGAGTTVHSPVVVTPQAAVAPTTVKGSGESGTATFQVTPGLAKFPIKAYGFAAAAPIAGTVASTENDAEKDYKVTVAPGTKAMQLTVRTDDPNAALITALFYQKDGDTAIGSGSELVGVSDYANDATLSVPSPKPGTYVLAVVTFGELPGTTTTAFGLQANFVTAKGGIGTLTVSPERPKVTPGTPLDVTVAWSGLTGGARHTGYVEYAGGPGTVVSVN